MRSSESRAWRRQFGRAALLVPLAAFIAVPSGAALAATGASGSGRAYVALGDSYSTGEGDGHYLAGTNTSADQCHRSDQAYPEVLDRSKHLGSLGFVSCSGAITADFFKPNNEGNHEPAQSRALSSATRKVTLTFGGNDLGFSDVLEQCVYIEYGSEIVHGAPGCAKNKSLRTTVANRLKALAGKAVGHTPRGVIIHSIASVLKEAHKLAPKAKIYLAGYPSLFGTSFKTQCGVGSVVVTKVPVHGTATVTVELAKGDAAWLNSVAASLVNVLKSAAAANRTTFVNVEPKFQGHGFCDTSKPWIRPFSGTYNYETKQLAFGPGVFHPTLTGQRSGYAAALSASGL